MSKRVRSSLILPAVCGLGLAAVLLSSCSSKAPQQPARQAGISGPGDYSRPHRDGAPWSGGALQFINQYGLKDFIARAQYLVEQYGERFEPPALLLEKAAKGELF